MAKVETLTVAIRDTHGKRRNQRMRNTGLIPAVLYGHKKETLSLTIKADEFDVALRHGVRFIALAGALNEKALIKQCQWDTWGKRVLHVDFTRVSEHEKIHVVVPVELHGEAIGIKDGGVVKLLLHEIKLECEAASVPEKIDVNINHLEFNHTMTVADLPLAEGIVPLVDMTQPVVSCLPPVEVADAESIDSGSVEPEVIGRKKTDDDEE